MSRNDRFNPCSYEFYARVMSWAETDCWCCTATRAMLVGALVGALVALLLAGALIPAITIAVIGIPLVMFLLWLARKLWTEESPDEDSGDR